MVTPNSRQMLKLIKLINRSSFIHVIIMIEENIGWDKLASLTDRAVCQAKISGGKIAYGLANHTVEVFNPVSKKIETLKTGHTKRLNCVSDYDTNILTCGNDGAVKLFDERIFKQVCHFKSNQINYLREPIRIFLCCYE